MKLDKIVLRTVRKLTQIGMAKCAKYIMENDGDGSKAIEKIYSDSLNQKTDRLPIKSSTYIYFIDFSRKTFVIHSTSSCDYSCEYYLHQYLPFVRADKIDESVYCEVLVDVIGESDNPGEMKTVKVSFNASLEGIDRCYESSLKMGVKTTLGKLNDNQVIIATSPLITKVSCYENANAYLTAKVLTLNREATEKEREEFAKNHLNYSSLQIGSEIITGSGIIIKEIKDAHRSKI